MNHIVLLSLCLSLFACATTVERSIASTQIAPPEKSLISTYRTDFLHFRLTKVDNEGLRKAKFQADAYDFTSAEGVRFFCLPTDPQQKQICGIGTIPLNANGHLVIDEVVSFSSYDDRVENKRKIFLPENAALTCFRKNDGFECDLEYYGLSSRQHDEKTFSLTFAEIASLRGVYPIKDRFEAQTQSGKFVCTSVVKDNLYSVQCQIGQTEIPWGFVMPALVSLCQRLDHPQLLENCLRAGSTAGWSYQCQFTNQETQEGICHFKSNQGLYSTIRIVLPKDLSTYTEINKITNDLLSQNKVISYKRFFAQRSYPQFCIQLDSLAAFQDFTKVKESYMKALSKYDKDLLWISYHKNCSSDLKDSASSEQPGYVD